MERTLYAADGLDRIKASAHWRDRIFEIDNEFDGSTHVDAKIAEFIELVISPYRVGGSNAPGYGKPLPANA